MKKISWVPGILSVTGLLLIIPFDTLPHFMPFKNETVLKFCLPSDNAGSPYSVFRLLDEIEQKQVITVSLSANKEEDDKKMILIQTEARRLKYCQDTGTVIKIQLSEDLTYGRFVELNNMMLAD